MRAFLLAILFLASSGVATLCAQSAAPAAAPVKVRPPWEIEWAYLSHYRDADARLGPPAPGERRVVFYGDSITEGWGVGGGFFPGLPYVNRGTSGQTTAQMLVRFRQDVIGLKPAVVLILAGTNDLAENGGPTTLEAIENNLQSMAELARANDIRVILASVLPAYDYPWRPGLHPAGKIAALNRWISDYCAATHLVYLDYFSQMVDGRGGLRADLGLDGVHPNAAGYAVMAPLAEQAISRALGVDAAVAMVGDSITFQGDWARVLGRSDVDNAGVPGFTTGQLAWTFKDILKRDPDVKVVFLEGGINDLSLGVSADRVFDNEVKAIDAWRGHGVTPVVQSVILQVGKGDVNGVITGLNSRLRTYCAAENVDFLDLNAVLSTDGGLRPDLSVDGTHLKPAGYALWAPVVAGELDRLGLGLRLVPASDPRFLYEGRFDFGDPASPVAVWEASRIFLDFDGDRAAVRFTGVKGQVFFDATLDGATSVLALGRGMAGGDIALPVAGTGRHRLELFKRSEASAGTAHFAGVGIAPGARAYPPALPHYRLKMEIYGDSITAGACDEDGEKDQWDDRRTHDAACSWAAIMARAFSADYRNISVSGIGLASGFDAVLEGQVWDRMYPEAGSPRADLGAWVPDVVLVLLGDNDDAYPRAHGLAFPPNFRKNYAALVHGIRAAYPRANIVLLNGAMWAGLHSEPLRKAWKAEVAELEAADPRISHYEFAHWTYGHPRVADHRALAAELTAWLGAQPFMKAPDPSVR